ncbi:MAG: ORF6N domain-containing protein [Nanoarchaeota archaeon]
MKENQLVFEESIKNKIYSLRGVQVMLDFDLAKFYEIKTKVLNQAVKRNIDRFPKDFMFQLNENEKNELVTFCDHLKDLKFSYQLPFAFTEQGISMLSAILKSKKAIEINIQIVRAFVSMRRKFSSNLLIDYRLEKIEQHNLIQDKWIQNLFDKFEKEQPKQGIFFDGHTFDAHFFVSKLIKKANNEIILIDNYIDDTTLSILSKKQKNVKLKILTKNLSKQLKYDIEKFKKQYGKIEIQNFNDSHDRFLIIDKDVYHIGASLKDLGVKWFGFSKLDESGLKILGKLNCI